MTTMPKIIPENINADLLTDEERKILNIVIKKDLSVRASKPKVTDDIAGKAAYVWRMVCFSVSPKRPHQCMPMCAIFDLPAYGENGKWSSPIAHDMGKELDKLVDIITNAVPKEQWYGIHRWGKAFGAF